MLSLFAHEFGHALAAQKLGLEVKEIVITPLGGLASISGLTARPVDEAKIAFAGPAVNLLIAAIAMLIPSALSSTVVFINLALGLGNLLPIFPLDGGRIIRGCFAAATNPVNAIFAAGKISKFVCLFFILLGIKLPILLVSIILGAYSVFSYKRELLAQILLTGESPTLSVGEVIKLTLRFFVTPRQKPESMDDSLENFGGSLEEFFGNEK